jgi:hypothetical protein
VYEVPAILLVLCVAGATGLAFVKLAEKVLDRLF